jgi:Cu+-exporting ATPase
LDAPGRWADKNVRAPTGVCALSDWRELRGQGVEARSPLGGLRLGSLAWLREAGVVTEPLPKFADNWADKGATVVGLAADAKLIGLFALRDTVKPRVLDVVQRLATSGQRSYLVTGDHPRTAAAVAQIAGIAPERVFASMRPEQKAGLLRDLQQQGERLAFVGDGINDAPALEQADLGVAVSRASDVAREAADLVLLRSDIEAIPEAIGLAQATLRTIKQNLFWAFFYNAAAVPLAALGFLSPILCAAAMGLSDLLVIGNALRLRRWRLR